MGAKVNNTTADIEGALIQGDLSHITPQSSTREELLKVMLSEYEELRAELREFQRAISALLNNIIIALVALPTLVAVLLQNNAFLPALGWLLALLPLPFLAIAILYTGYARSIVLIARYTYDRLGADIRFMLDDAESNHGVKNVLEWATYQRRDIIYNNLVLTGGVFLVLAIPVIGSYILIAVLWSNNTILISAGIIWIIVLDVVITISTIAFAVLNLILGKSNDE